MRQVGKKFQRLGIKVLMEMSCADNLRMGGWLCFNLCLRAEVIALPAVAAKILHSQSSPLQLFHPFSFPSVFPAGPSSLQAVHPSHPLPMFL